MITLVFLAFSCHWMLILWEQVQPRPMMKLPRTSIARDHPGAWRGRPSTTTTALPPQTRRTRWTPMTSPVSTLSLRTRSLGPRSLLLKERESVPFSSPSPSLLSSMQHRGRNQLLSSSHSLQSSFVGSIITFFLKKKQQKTTNNLRGQRILPPYLLLLPWIHWRHTNYLFILLPSLSCRNINNTSC